MGNNKPLVQAACICETVVFDKDEAPSIIRIVDIFTIEALGNIPAGVPFGFPVIAFVRVKFQDNAPEGVLSIQPKRPDGSIGTRQHMPVPAGNHENVQFKTAFHVMNPQEGKYTFEVYWNDELLTTIPLKVVFK